MAVGMQQATIFEGFDEVKRNWRWFFLLGVLLILLGAAAAAAAALTTVVSVVVFGWLLLIAGVLTAGHALWEKQWSGFFVDLFVGILYFVTGAMIVGNPQAAAITLTLVIAMFLIVGGVFRIVAGLAWHFEHRGWVVLNGIITLLLGILIWQQWPFAGLWVIGLFVGIDLILYGVSLVMLALGARRLVQQQRPATPPQPSGAR